MTPTVVDRTTLDQWTTAGQKGWTTGPPADHPLFSPNLKTDLRFYPDRTTLDQWTTPVDQRPQNPTPPPLRGRGVWIGPRTGPKTSGPPIPNIGATR